MVLSSCSLKDSDVSRGGGHAGPPEPFQAGVHPGRGRDGLSAGCVSQVLQRSLLWVRGEVL